MKINTQILEDFVKSSTLASYFNEKGLIEELLLKSNLISIEEGDAIYKRGELLSELIIVVTGRVISATDQGPHKNHGPGEEVNLYSFLNRTTCLSDAFAAESSMVIKVPYDVFISTSRDEQELKNYLKFKSEYFSFQQMIRDLNDINVSNEFKVFILGNLKLVELGPEYLISKENIAPDIAFFIQHGSIFASNRKIGSDEFNSWPVRETGWINLRECISQKGSSATFATVAKSAVFQITRDVLEVCKVKFPFDFEAFVRRMANLERPAEDIESEYADRDHDFETFITNPELLSTRPIWFRYPWIPQHDEMDCGPACLSMISSFWGNDLPLQFWRQKLQTNQLGTVVLDMANVAERNGFITHPVYIEDLSELDDRMLPAIVLRKNHYLVLYKISRKHVIVGDPAIGIRRISHKEFYDGFEHAVLVLKPLEEFLKQKGSKPKYSHYLKFMKIFKLEMAIVFLISLFMILLALVPPFSIQIFLDRILKTKDENMLLWLFGVGIVTAASSAILNHTRGKYIIYIVSRFDFIALSTFFKKFFTLPYDFIANRHLGDFTRRVSELERLRDFFTQLLLSISLDLITIVAFGIVLFMFNIKLMIATYIFCIGLVVVTLLYSTKLNKAYQETFSSQTEQDSLISDTIKGIATIKTMNSESTSRWRLENRIALSLKARSKFFTAANNLTNLTGLLSDFGKMSLIVMVAYLTLNDELTTGQMISASVLITSSLGPFTNLAHSWAGIQEIRAVANRLNDIFLTQSETKTSTENLVLENFLGEIEFQDVWFRYGGESNSWALKGVSFKIESGTSVALVGPSGSGKTTIGLLLGGLYKPSKGRILVDNRDIGDYDPTWLRQRLGFILQEPSLFYGTVAQNIALTTPLINYKKVREVAEIANATEFISKKPNSFDYLITHGGIGLSAGEKQRIAFARALYSNPKVLILDEATSALDGISEREIIRSLKNGNRTLINIAHRYSTAMASDFVILLDKGNVVGIGPHNYLAKSNVLYRQIFNLDERDGIV